MQADPAFLRDEFSVAASFLYAIDLPGLLQPVERWDAGKVSNISDPIGRANFAVKHAGVIARRMKRVCGLDDAGPIELEAARQIEQATTRIGEELKSGSSLPVMRREWDRAIGTLVENLAGFMVPLLDASNRNGVPDPRNG